MNGDSDPLEEQNGNALPFSEEEEPVTEKQLAAQSIEELAAEVQRLHFKVIGCQKHALQYAREAGRRLILLKSKYEHGDGWSEYLQEDFQDSPETARAYMRVARNWLKIVQYTYRPTRLSLRQALRLLAVERGKAAKDSTATLRKQSLSGFTRELKGWSEAEVRCLAENQDAVWEVLRREVRRMEREGITSDGDEEEEPPTHDHHTSSPTIIRRPTLWEGLARNATHLT